MEEKICGLEIFINVVIDSGRFDVRVFGGVARNFVKCCFFVNGDIVVRFELF